MDGTSVAQDYSSLVDDRVGEGMFRVDRSIYTDRGVFEDEMRNIFESSWVFLCHEGQVVGEGDYFATEIGRQPVFVSVASNWSWAETASASRRAWMRL